MSNQEKELLNKTKQLIGLLEKYPQQNWAMYFEDVLKEFRTDQFHSGAKKVIGAFGGMGSFNECDLTGAKEEEYQKFLKLKESIYKLAKEVKFQNSWFGKLIS